MTSFTAVVFSSLRPVKIMEWFVVLNSTVPLGNPPVVFVLGPVLPTSVSASTVNTSSSH